jgi:hypothetical protein
VVIAGLSWACSREQSLPDRSTPDDDNRPGRSQADETAPARSPGSAAVDDTVRRRPGVSSEESAAGDPAREARALIGTSIGNIRVKNIGARFQDPKIFSFLVSHIQSACRLPFPPINPIPR